jgi:hypothetical protein
MAQVPILGEVTTLFVQKMQPQNELDPDLKVLTVEIPLDAMRMGELQAFVSNPDFDVALAIFATRKKSALITSSQRLITP